jgi:hypothetical protein
MPDLHLRAADVDRTAVAETLGRHLADGRLTVEEYDERLTRAYAARTYGELAELTTDLPATPSPQRVATAPRHLPFPTACGAGGSLRAAWAGWLTTASIVLTIWLASAVASGDAGYFWPIWVIGPWGVAMAVRTMRARVDAHRPMRG